MQRPGERAGEHSGDRSGGCTPAGCTIGVMAKAPIPGRAKTRLTPLLTPQEAAALSAAFLRDVTENVRCAARLAPIQGCIAYAPAGAEALFDGHLAEGTGLVLADGSPLLPPRVQGFGRCLLHAIQAMLADGQSAACVLNSDSPTLPTALLIEATRLLLERPDRVVLGPAEDGGYYLLGMSAPHAHLFEDIAWSTDTVAEATRARARTLGLELVELTPCRRSCRAAAPDRGDRGAGGWRGVATLRRAGHRRVRRPDRPAPRRVVTGGAMKRRFLFTSAPPL
jgi:rSAM/selenodomain-associated transferase 1